jgi:cell division protein FtsB
MENEQVNPQLVIESLSNQVAAMSRDIAVLQAINAQLRAHIEKITSEQVADPQ